MWAGWEQVCNRRQGSIRGDGGLRAGKRVGVWKDGDPTARECMESEENKRGQHWGVLRAGWNAASHVRGHNKCYRVNRTVQMTVGRVQKGSHTGGGIRMESLNIRTKRVVG